jgi:peptide/nickel transport system substrate-binding protein
VLELSVIAGWSDWVRACQVMSRSFRELGIDVRVRAYDQNAWFEKVQNGEFDLSMGWTGDGDTPWRIYHELMSTETVQPFGESAFVNWHRFGDDEATELLRRFEAMSDFEERRRVAWRLSELFIEKAPAIPIFLNPSWGQCNSKRFVGWPSPENPYARLSTNHPPESLLVMTRIEPAPGSGYPPPAAEEDS